MRKFLPLLLSLCLMLSWLPAQAEVYPTSTPIPGYTLRKSADEVRVFAAQSTKAKIVGYIIPGGSQEVHVLYVNGDWCYISFTSIDGTSYGYVPLSCFDVAAKPTPTPRPSTTFESGTAAWVVNLQEGYRLNLREEPSYTAASLGKYYTGAPVTLTGQVENGFAQVLLAGIWFGWMDVRYLNTNALSFVPEMPQVSVSNPGSGAVLRSGPGTSHSRVGWYPHGTAVIVMGVRADGWYHVMVNESVGYMSESVLSGSFPYGYGMDSDNPTLSDGAVDDTLHYVNTRSSNGVLNLRKSASSSARSLGKFYTGTPLTILSYTRTGWAYVRIGQTEGYMDADYLTATQPTRCGDARVIRNSRANGLNFRTAPSTGGELIAFLPNYTQVTVLGELSDGWCYVQYEGMLGYMLGSSLESVN